MGNTWRISRTSKILLMLILAAHIVEAQRTIKPIKLTLATFIRELIPQEFDSCDLFFISLDSQPTVTSSPYCSEAESCDITTRTVASAASLSPEYQAMFVGSVHPKQDTHKQIYSGIRLARKYAQCALVTTLVQSVKPSELSSLSLKFSEMFTKVSDEVTRKDEDFYVFFSDGSRIESVLQSPMAMDIKFKLGLFQHSASEKDVGRKERHELQGRTVAFYPAPGKVISIPLDKPYKKQRLFPDFTKNGRGHVLEIAVPIRILFLYEIYKTEEGVWKDRRGLYKPFFDMVMIQKLNFTLNYWPSSFGAGTGTTLKNGTWVGGIRDLIDKKADIAPCTSPNYSRFKLVGFTKPICFAWANFAVGLPKAFFTWSAIYEPLSTTVWLLTVLSSVFTILTFKLIQRFHRGPGSSDVFNRHHWTHLAASLLDQGFEDPSSSLTRSILCIWLLLTLIISTLYRSKLVELMAFPTLGTQPRNFPELATTPGFKWGLANSAVGSSAHNHFKSSTNPIYKKIYDEMQIEKDSHACIKKTIDNQFACIGWDGGAEYLLHKNFSSMGRVPFVMSEDLTLFVPSGFAIQERALFRTSMDYFLDTTREMGVVFRWKTIDDRQLQKGLLNWERSVGIRHRSGQDGPPTLILEHMTGPIIVLVAGVVSATLIAALELYANRGLGTTLHVLIAIWDRWGRWEIKVEVKKKKPVLDSQGFTLGWGSNRIEAPDSGI